MSLIKKYKSDNSGAIAAITGIVIFALVASAGAAIEITRIVHYKSKLQHAADSAVLAAISQSSTAYKEFSNTPGQDGINIPQGAEDIRKFFTGNSGGNEGVNVDVTTAKVEIQNANLVSNIDYTAKIDLIFGKLLQYPSVEVTGHAEARREIDVSKTKSKPIDVHFFLDNSPSMGIGSREEDIAILQNQDILGRKGCAFACHLDNPKNDTIPANLDSLRNNKRLMLRIDELREATSRVISDVENYQIIDKIVSPKDKIRFSAYSFAHSQIAAKNEPIRTLFELTSDYANQKVAVLERSNFDMQKVGYNIPVDQTQPVCIRATYNGCDESRPPMPGEMAMNFRERDNSPISEAMSFVDKKIKGNKSDRNQLLFIVTDGMANFSSDKIGKCYEIAPRQRFKEVEQQSGKLGDCIGPIDLQMCQYIKENGTKIAIVYTKYRNHIKTYDKEFINIALPQLDNVENNLQKCASPNLFSTSGFSGNIYKTMRDVFQRATMNLKLVE